MKLDINLNFSSDYKNYRSKWKKAQKNFYFEQNQIYIHSPGEPEFEDSLLPLTSELNETQSPKWAPMMSSNW